MPAQPICRGMQATRIEFVGLAGLLSLVSNPSALRKPMPLHRRSRRISFALQVFSSRRTRWLIYRFEVIVFARLFCDGGFSCKLATPT